MNESSINNGECKKAHHKRLMSHFGKDRYTGLKKIKISVAGEQMGEVMKRKRRDDDVIKNIQHLECFAE